MASSFQPSGLGVGVVWWPPLDALCREDEGLIDVVEIEPEAFWVSESGGCGFRSFATEAVRHLSQHRLVHSVGASVGGTCPEPNGHAETLARDVLELRPQYLSEHLNLTQFRPQPGATPVSAGFMLPSLQSRLGVDQTVRNIHRHREGLSGLPIAIETAVSYLPPLPGEWPDGEFVAAVAECADCGILLDLHNVLCNARNGRQSCKEFCEALPLDRVWEIHLAGGESERGFYLDAHSGLIDSELFELAAELTPKLPNLSAITFEISPERVASTGLSAIARQLEQMRDLWDKRTFKNDESHNPVRPLPSSEPMLNDPESWERLLGCAITGFPVQALTGQAENWWRSSKEAVDLYRSLAEEARASALLSAAPHTVRLLMKKSGTSETRRILAGYWRESPPQYTAVDEALAFFRFLTRSSTVQPELNEAMSRDCAELAAIE